MTEQPWLDPIQLPGPDEEPAEAPRDVPNPAPNDGDLDVGESPGSHDPADDGDIEVPAGIHDGDA